MSFSPPPWVMGLLGSILFIVLTGGTALYVRSEAVQVVDNHDGDESSHSRMHTTLRQDQADIINRQTHLQGEINHLKANQGDMKLWLRKIDDKLDKALSQRD